MTAIGETLRRERLKRKLELDQISRELKISPKFLEAIEDEAFDKIPGGVFAKSFVRQYARMMGLDEEEMAAEVSRAMAPPPSLQQLAEREKPRGEDIRVSPVEMWQTSGERSWSSSLPAFAGVVVVMLICSGVYAWWQRSRTPAVAQDTAPAVTAPASPPAPVETAQTAPAPASPGAAAAAPAPSPLVPASKSAPAAAPPSSPAASETSPAASAAPLVNPSGPSAVRVELTADETVWVLARADDKYLFSGTLEAKQTRTVEGNDKVLLRLGNAGGVSITLNGKPLGAVGPKGQVRTVQFTSGGFQIVAAPPKPSLPLD